MRAGNVEAVLLGAADTAFEGTAEGMDEEGLLE